MIRITLRLLACKLAGGFVLGDTHATSSARILVVNVNSQYPMSNFHVGIERALFHGAYHEAKRIMHTYADYIATSWIFCPKSFATKS